jgi:WD40 repeat protein
MMCRLRIVVCVFASLFTQLAFAQLVPDQTDPAKPVAYVYVSTYATTGEISAFAASSSGRLTPVSGSPFPGVAAYLAANRNYLFGDDNVGNIYTYSIAGDGAPTQVSSINAEQYNNCGPYALFVDRTGATLYDRVYECNASNAYQFLGIQPSTGDLTYLGVTDSSTAYYVPLSFLASNLYAYGAQCNGNMYWSIFGFQRNQDGTLIPLNASLPTPTPEEGHFYCPLLTTTDNSDHVVISMQAVLQTTFGSDGLPQLAVYTADNAGNLTTTNTYSDMPRTAVQSVIDISFSPSGKLVAVGGAAGLQIFHFKGASPLTPATGLLTTDEIDQLFWDNADHLYAISQSDGKLFVFTITPAGAKQAPGSPHAITGPLNMAVVPR